MDNVGGEVLAKIIHEFLIAFFTAFFSRWLEDFFIVVGLIVLVVNTYLISVVALNVLLGNYLLALILLLAGIAIAKR